MTDAARLRLTVEDGIARLVLANPDKHNVIDPQWAREWKAICADLAGRDDVRVIALTAEGRSFCVGGDVGPIASAEDPYAALHSIASDLHAGLLSLAAIDAPVVAGVQGVAAGAGLSLVLAADLAVAGRAASFAVAYTGVGLSPDGGSSYWLPRRVGHRRAVELMITNRRVGAEEAATIGIVTETVDDEALAGRVEEIAASLATGATASFGAVRRLLAASFAATLEDQLAAEAESIATLAASPTGREGVAAFVQKRTPSFPAR